jgi:hypothetical protein
MAVLPHDISDLYLAPVVLALDAQIEELSQLDVDQLARRVALEANTAGWTRDQRESGLLEAIRHVIDCHDWQLAWDSRGVRLTHDQHRLVLGVPATFGQYLSGSYSGAVREGDV